MYDYDAKSAYKIINARHQDIRYAKAANEVQPGRMARTVMAAARFARHINWERSEQQVITKQPGLGFNRTV